MSVFIIPAALALICISSIGQAQIPDFNATLEAEEQAITAEAARVESIDTLFATVRDASTLDAKAQAVEAYCEPMTELYRQFTKYQNDASYVAHQGYDISELRYRMGKMQTTVLKAGGDSTHTVIQVETLIESYLVEKTKITVNLRIAYSHLAEVEIAVISQIAKILF
jgi:hypothetical protein